jgi:hypothetical protein
VSIRSSSVPLPGWIERDGPGQKGCTVFRFIEYVGVHVSRQREHQKIILVELDRSFDELPGASKKD